MAKKTTSTVKEIEQYTHSDKKRANNPQVGLVTPETDRGGEKQKYEYDPHLDPQLNWAGKSEHTSFEVPTVSLHVHERIDPRSIVEAVRRKHETESDYQPSLFFGTESNLPLFQEIEFYKHKHNWANRLIAGDSTLVMNSLLVKEGMASAVQMVYFDPPYGIKYGSNFQPFVNKRDVKDGKDDDLTSEPETLKAFRDTWELGIHSYLTYLRDRLLLTRELLHESGSIFVQISDENVHLVRNLMDEVFGVENFIGMISFQKKGSQTGEFLPPIHEYIVWYGKDKKVTKFKQLYTKRDLSGVGGSGFNYLELQDGTIRALTDEEKDGFVEIKEGRVFRYNPLFSAKSGPNDNVEINGISYPSGGNSWKVSPSHIPRLFQLGRVIAQNTRLVFKRYAEDFNFVPISNVWSGFGGASDKVYVVQTNVKIAERCLLMTTDPSDLVLDITCGSGTTAFVAEQWGRRWITCDTSRVALTLAKQRLMTATFDYFQLANQAEGVASGFKYKTVPHVTLKSIANNEPPATETLYDQPLTEKSTARVTSPFTVEAVPAPVVQSLNEAGEVEPTPADNSIARSGESLRQDEWRSELLRTGIRGRRGEKMMFSRVEPLAGTRFLHADAELVDSGERIIDNEEQEKLSNINYPLSVSQRAVVSFSPEHEPMPPAQVELALLEANKLFPKPKFVIFAAFQFDPVAAQNIEETNWHGVTLLKAQMNDDLKTADLKKNRASNESFWLIGQPDVNIKEVGKNDKKEKLYEVEVLGFDYYNVKEGTIESGGTNRIAVWMLDTNFDGRSLLPHQVFFPLSGEKEGWTRLAKNLKAEIDAELIESYHGSVSLPFTVGDKKRVAVKIVDDRGIESLKLIDVI
jgi:adenine-specific DNA-methyltransferase